MDANKAFESAAARAGREAGWKFRRAPGLWTHPDDATFAGRAVDLCEHYGLQIIDDGELVLNPDEAGYQSDPSQ
jgi:hypothetical protein